MKRVLQKHGKTIMTVLGIVLMIVFALPSLTGSRNPTNSVVGKLDGKAITAGELSYYGSELKILNRIGYQNQLQRMLDSRDANLNWFLLLREAGRYGFDNSMFTDEQVDAQLERNGLSKPLIDSIIVELGVAHSDLNLALSHLEWVQDYENFVFSLPRPLSEIELTADTILKKVQVGYATFDAARELQGDGGWKAPAATEDQIKKQFELYKGVERTVPRGDLSAPGPLPPEIAGHHYAFGYKYPNRVSVEYLVFDRAALRSKFKATQDDYDAAYKYYREHAAEFVDTTSPAATASSRPVSRTFDEMRQKLVDREVEARISKQLARIMDRAKEAVGQGWHNAATEDSGYRDIPPQKEWTSYQKVAEDLSKNLEFDGYKPEYKTAAEWMDATQLAAIPGIGEATYEPPNQGPPIAFADLASRVHELVEISARDPVGKLYLQVGVEGPPLEDKVGNKYLFRVTRAEKSHEPATVEEVRPQVVKDLQSVAAYEHARSQAEELKAALGGPGAGNARDLVTLATEKKIPADKTVEFNRIPDNTPLQLAGIRGFIDAAFRLADARPATRAQSSPATLPAADRPSTVLANDDTLRVYVLQLLEVLPSKPADFAEELMHERMSQYLYPGQQPTPLIQSPREELLPFVRDYFTLESLFKRMKYVSDTLKPKEKKAGSEG